MELKFVSNSPDARSKLKRSQACETCRRKKKRCMHAVKSSSGRQLRGERIQSQGIDVTRVPPEEPPEDGGNDKATHEHGGVDALIAASVSVSEQSKLANRSYRSPSAVRTEPPIWRFVGDLNPEALFQRQTGSVGHGGKTGSDKVGVWQSHYVRNELSTPSTVASWRATQGSPTGEIAEPTPESPAPGRHFTQTAPLPPKSDQDALIDIYFERVNSILPLIDENSFREEMANESASIILIQAICLTAAKDYRARSHLKLDKRSDVLSVADFCHALATALDAAFQTRIEKNRLTLIRALALSSLHVDGPDGAEEASMQLTQAVHHAHTLGLHLDNARREMQDETLGNLFWSLWSLDRLNACVNGRPILMSNVDIGIKVRESRSHNSDAFRLWLHITDMVDQIVVHYRPSTDDLSTGWEDEYPGFEELVRNCDALQLPMDTLQTLELYYHAVTITSNRSQSFKAAPRSTASSVRQSMSAICIIPIIEEHNAHNLLPLPVVPYSLSLSLSVSYKHLRQTGLNTAKVQATSQLGRCCKLLEILGRTWWAADAMAKLGRRALNEVNKAPAKREDALGERIRKDRSQENDDTVISPMPATAVSSDDYLLDDSSPSQPPGHSTPGQKVDSLVTDQGQLIEIAEDPSADNPMGFDTTFAGIDQLLGDYLDLNLPTNFGDPLFIDDFYLVDQMMPDHYG